MKISDIIALAKQGYKPSDIKELAALMESDSNDNVPSDSGTLGDDQNKESLSQSTAEPGVHKSDYNGETKPADEEGGERKPDGRQAKEHDRVVKELNDKIKELQDSLAAARKLNVNQPAPEEISDQQRVDDIVRSFM